METPIEYTAQAASTFISGEVKIKIDEHGLSAAALFDTAVIPFAEVNGLIMENNAVTVKAEGGDYVFSRMGNWCGPFYDALYGAYNKAVLRAFFIKGAPLLSAYGAFHPVHVYENCVVSLPPDLSARRAPLCFAAGMEKGDYKLTLRTDDGESYTYAKLGYDAEPFADAVEKQIRALREQTIGAVKEVDPTLSAAQASQIAKLMPMGVAAAMGEIAEIAPSFLAALEGKLADTHAAWSYPIFKELCDPARIHIGFNPSFLWLTAPSPDGNFAAVEFSEEDMATFIYRTGGDFTGFTKQLNRALEAIDFRREVIRLTDGELKKPENADYYMAAKRTASLKFIRSNFAGRVIHSNSEAWKRKLLESFK